MDKCKPPRPRDAEEEEDDGILKNPYSRIVEILDRVTELGKFTTIFCQDALKEQYEREVLLEKGIVDFPPSFMEQNARVKQCVHLLLSQWTEFYVENMASMREIQNIKLGEGRPYPTTLGAHIFYEMSRLHWLREFPAAALEWENTQLIDDLIPQNYNVLFSLAHTKSDAWIQIMTSLQEGQSTKINDETEHAVSARELKERMLNMWNKPISQYTMSETRALAMFLTQYLNDVQESQMEEYARVFKILWLRCTEIMVSEYQGTWTDTLDESEFTSLKTPKGPGVANKRYAVFCSFYLGEITRRFFHREELASNRFAVDKLPPPELLERMRARMMAWTLHIVDSFAEEAFEEMYMSIVTGDEGGYAYPGDGSWFRYAFPQNVPSRGAIVTALRPHMYRRFFSEIQVNRQLVVKQCAISHLSRLFVLKAVDEHIKITHARVEWINGVVIDNDGIEMSAYALKGNLAPLLVQVFSNYWVYHDGYVYPTDDIFTTLSLWWWLLREHHDSKLYKVDLSDFMHEILEPRNNNSASMQALEVQTARFEL